METQTIHIGNLILNQLKADGRSVVWLATKVNRHPSALCRQLRNAHIHTDLLLRISIALDIDFFAYYSNYLSENKTNKNIMQKLP
jgi:hypothetical protein